MPGAKMADKVGPGAYLGRRRSLVLSSVFCPVSGPASRGSTAACPAPSRSPSWFYNRALARRPSVFAKPVVATMLLMVSFPIFLYRSRLRPSSFLRGAARCRCNVAVVATPTPMQSSSSAWSWTARRSVACSSTRDRIGAGSCSATAPEGGGP